MDFLFVVDLHAVSRSVHRVLLSLALQKAIAAIHRLAKGTIHTHYILKRK